MVERPVGQGAADQLRHGRELLDAVDGGVELLVVEEQPLDQGCAEAAGRFLFASSRHVLGVGFEHGLARIRPGKGLGKIG